jgi:GT2 family glycosyltransferase
VNEKVGAVVLAYGSDGSLAELLGDLTAGGIQPADVTVVHNPSREREVLERADARHDFLSSDYNAGYAAGMNIGLRRRLARGDDVVLLVTQEVRFEDGGVARLLDAAGRAPSFGVLGPALLWRERGEPFSYGGVLHADGRIEHLLNRPQVADGVAECDWVDGAAMVIRRVLVEDVGFLDERFFLYFEDTEFCLRATRAGWRIGVVLDAKAEQSPGGGRRSGAYEYLYTRNGLEFAARAAGVGGLRVALGRQLKESTDLLRIRCNPRSPSSTRRTAQLKLHGTFRGAADFMLRKWGPPPPRLARLGGIENTRRRRRHGRVSAPPS